MSTKQDALARGASRLAATGIESPRLDARVLMAEAMGIAPEDLIGARKPSPAELARFEECLARREAHEPLAYIIGRKEFWSLDFEVGPGVLVPRPESETLIEEAMKEFPDRALPLDVLDLGTGSGCLVIAFLASYRNARGEGIDRSPEALAWARRNVARHGLHSRCVLSQSDWSAEGRYDLVLSNPPYLSQEELKAVAPAISGYEPHGALDGGADGLAAYRVLAPLLARVLKPGGRAVLEIGSSQADSVQTVLKQDGIGTLRIVHDLAGHPRAVVAATRP
jgi:release factor glutamine methyltransferase